MFIITITGLKPSTVYAVRIILTLYPYDHIKPSTVYAVRIICNDTEPDGNEGDTEARNRGVANADTEVRRTICTEIKRCKTKVAPIPPKVLSATFPIIVRWFLMKLA